MYLYAAFITGCRSQHVSLLESIRILPSTQCLSESIKSWPQIKPMHSYYNRVDLACSDVESLCVTGEINEHVSSTMVDFVVPIEQKLPKNLENAISPSTHLSSYEGLVNDRDPLEETGHIGTIIAKFSN